MYCSGNERVIWIDTIGDWSQLYSLESIDSTKYRRIICKYYMHNNINDEIILTVVFSVVYHNILSL